MNKEEIEQMNIAHCKICTLTQSHCADCPLNWALKLIEIPLKVIEPKVIEILV